MAVAVLKVFINATVSATISTLVWAALTSLLIASMYRNMVKEWL
jgi:hypothetical protein